MRLYLSMLVAAREPQISCPTNQENHLHEYQKIGNHKNRNHKNRNHDKEEKFKSIPSMV